jgi:hypothetical protein
MRSGGGRASGVIPSPARCQGPAGATQKDPAASAHGEPPTKGATEAEWDRLDLLGLVDALAEYAADLLSDGRLDGLLPRADGPDDPNHPKIAFTTPIPPFIK